MKIIFQIEDYEKEQYSEYLEKLFKLIEESPVKPELEVKNVFESVSRDTPMLEFNLTERWKEKIELYGKENCEDGILRLGQFVGLKNYLTFMSKSRGGYLTTDDLNSITSCLKEVLKKLWTPGMEIPIDALRFHDPTRKTIFKAKIGGETFKDPDYEWDVCNKTKRNTHAFHFLCALIDYIFNPTDELVALSDLRKAGKIQGEELIDGNKKYDHFREEFAKITEKADYRLEMSIEEAFAGVNVNILKRLEVGATVKTYDKEAHKTIVDHVMDFGEFTEKFKPASCFCRESLEAFDIRIEFILRLESIIKKLWTEDIGVIKVSDLGLCGSIESRYNMYCIKDFKNPEDLHNMYVGVTGSCSITRMDTLLRVIHYLLRES